MKKKKQYINQLLTPNSRKRLNKRELFLDDAYFKIKSDLNWINNKEGFKRK